MSERIERCDRCRFWTEWAEDAGLCRRNAPVAIPFGMLGKGVRNKLLENEETDTSQNRDAIWPTTFPEDWCGEFQPTPSNNPT